MRIVICSNTKARSGRGRRRRRRSAKLAPNLLAPASRRLGGDENAAFSQEQINIPQAEAEHVAQARSVADDLGGEPVALVGIRWRLHAASLADLRGWRYLVTVTMPTVANGRRRVRKGRDRGSQDITGRDLQQNRITASLIASARRLIFRINLMFPSTYIIS